MSYDFKSLSLPFGYVSAVPTPFLGDDGAIDDDAFSAFCHRQIADGIAGLVVCGITGEAPTLTAEEHRCLVGLAVRAAAGRAPVIAGADATALGFLAMGGDGCISVTSNVAPALCVGLYAAVQGGDMGEAQRIALILDELTAALCNESNPVPVKARSN
jgi:dihydrodipicolinate synthase/N-acetylneuraminate lyase